MLAPIRLGNATASLQLRCQPRRKEKHPHHPSTPLPPLRGSSMTGRPAGAFPVVTSAGPCCKERTRYHHSRERTYARTGGCW